MSIGRATSHGEWIHHGLTLGAALMNRILSLILAAIATLLASCASLPPPKDRIASTAITDTADTRLGRAVVPYVTPNPGKSGVHKFPDPHDAFAARVRLAAAAEETL